LSTAEREMVTKIIAGDGEAFRVFYDTHKRPLLRACWYFLGDDPETEDVVQETFIKAVQNLKNFRFESSLATWMNHIAVNLCRDLLDKKKKSLPVSVEFFAPHPSREQEGTSYPEEVVTILREEIQNLEGRDKELLHLREIQGMSYEAIAHRLKMPLGSVTSGIYRARQKLIERVRKRLPNGWEGNK
jgi:RNA polymerase sigma-70 factor, ECF subfamily